MWVGSWSRVYNCSEVASSRGDGPTSLRITILSVFVYQSTSPRRYRGSSATSRETAALSVFLGIYLVLFTLALLWIIGSDALRERCHLFSTRNIFLAGLILFQSASGAVTLFTGETERGAHMDDFALPGLGFSVILTVFTVLFLWVYNRANAAERLAARFTHIRVTSQTRLVVAGILLTGIGVGLRFVGAQIPYVAILLPQLAAGCLCGGVAFVAVAWARSAFNILIAFILLGTTAASSAILLVGTFGRREILGILFSIMWSLYYEKWRLMSAAWLLPRVAIASAGLSVVVLAVSSSRVSGENVDRSLTQQVERVFTIDPQSVQENVIAALSGQFAGGISMWILEARVRYSEYDPLHSLVYFITLPIPRDFWKGKPEGLGLIVVDEAGVTGVSEGHSWGPGLVGHLSHDFVLISLPIYAFLLALTFRYIDTRVSLSQNDPLTSAIFGSALGQVLGMPRGDLGLFAFNMVAAFSGVWVFGRLAAKLCMPIDRQAELDASSDEEFNDESSGDENHETWPSDGYAEVDEPTERPSRT